MANNTDMNRDEIPARPLPADDSLAGVERLSDLGRVFFSGIGGSGMSVLAQMLFEAGVPVYGSDRTASSYTKHLQDLGIDVIIGQKAENVRGADTVVWSSAIPADAPEMLEARKLGIRLAHRSDILALLLRVHRSIAVAGTHGKTTTSSMSAMILTNAVLSDAQKAEKLGDPSFAIGGSVKTSDGTVPGGYVGTGAWMVAECDESDGSFCKYRPLIAVITNAEGDHLDHYGTTDNYRAAFVSFAGHAQKAIVLCGDDEGARYVYSQLTDAQREMTYVYSTSAFADCASAMPGLVQERFAHIGHPTEIAADDSDSDIEETFTLELPAIASLNGRRADPTSINVGLKVPGIHNARNASAAIIATVLAGLSPQQAAVAAGTFLGAARRFDFQGMADGVRLYNDYGHHPTEMATFLAAVRKRFPGHAVRILFQPHTYSRTEIYTKELVSALSAADDVYLSGIFAARELASDFPGISSQTLIDEANRTGVGDRFTLIDDKADAARAMAQASKPGDILATVGGGDINLVNPLILQVLTQKAAE